jgi:rod shape-determining protein MreB
MTDLAMDLGTANTLVYVPGRGIILNEPSMVAISLRDNQVVCVGNEARAMHGKTPGLINVVRPIRDGVVADYDVTKHMITYFINKAITSLFRVKPKIIIGVPSGITQVEKRAVIDAAIDAGVKEVRLVEEPVAAAIGTGMPIGESCGNLIVDIGGGTTEVAIISMLTVAYVESIRVAGDELDEAMARFIKTKCHLEIGAFEGERVKIAIGSAFKLEQGLKLKVKGKDIVSGLPNAILLTDSDVHEALIEPINGIVRAVRRAMENTTPEFAEDIGTKGIVLTGGGSMIKGIGKRLNVELNVPVYRAIDPLLSVALGVGKVLEEWSVYKNVTIN